MFMIKIYGENGAIYFMDNSKMFTTIEEVNKRIREDMEEDKNNKGASFKTYVVVPINFQESRMCVDIPMLDKEVEITDITFTNGSKGFIVEGESSIASFLLAWIDKHAIDIGYNDFKIVDKYVDGNTIKFIVKDLSVVS